MAHPLSVQLYSVRNHAGSREEILRRLAEIGFTAVEPFNPTDRPEDFRKSADDLGLVVSATHAFALMREEPGPVFEAVAALGTSLAIVPGGTTIEDFSTLDAIARLADRLNGLAEQAATFGLRLGYHNHFWEFEAVVDGRHGLELLVEQVAPEIVFEVDTYWAAVGGADVPAVLGRLGDRVEALHVKDGPVVKVEPNVAVGTGSMDVPAVLAAAPAAWRVVEFDECATDVFDALAASHAYLTGLEQS
jgi:sugar phosphate isomerase/epimerase